MAQGMYVGLTGMKSKTDVSSFRILTKKIESDSMMLRYGWAANRLNEIPGITCRLENMPDPITARRFENEGLEQW